MGLIKKVFGLARYRIFQQYIWRFLLNRNGNQFFCKGRLINCSISVKGSHNYIEISKDVKLNNVRISIAGNHCVIVDSHIGQQFHPGHKR